MFEFWYSLGVNVTDERLERVIRAAKPKFCFVDRRVIVDTVDGKDCARQGVSSGNLLKNSTEKLMDVMNAFFEEHYPDAPPVTIGCAGRYCQLENIQRLASGNPRSSFRDVLKLYRKACASVAPAGGKPRLSRNALALLGLCAMDGAVRQYVLESAGKTPNRAGKAPNRAGGGGSIPVKLAKVLRAFRVNPAGREFKVVRDLVASELFGRAFDLFWDEATSDNQPWIEGSSCDTQMIWWEGRSDYAIP